MLNHSASKTLSLSLMTLVLFFQLLSDFVESIYVFGLLGTSNRPEVAWVLLFLATVILLPVPSQAGRSCKRSNDTNATRTAPSIRLPDGG